MCTHFVCSSLFRKYFHLCAWKVWLSPRLRNLAVFYARLLSEPGDTSDWEDEKSGLPFGFCLLSKIASCGRTSLHNCSNGAFGLDSRNLMRAETLYQRFHFLPSWLTFDQNPTKASWRTDDCFPHQRQDSTSRPCITAKSWSPTPNAWNSAWWPCSNTFSQSHLRTD